MIKLEQARADFIQGGIEWYQRYDEWEQAGNKTDQPYIKWEKATYKYFRVRDTLLKLEIVNLLATRKNI